MPFSLFLVFFVAMSRRKHVALDSLLEEVKPPSEGQAIVRALGSRGSNIFEVRANDGPEAGPTKKKKGRGREG